MAQDEIILNEGSHLKIQQVMKDAEISLDAKNDVATLLLAAQPHQARKFDPRHRPVDATTLEIRMTVDSARELFEQLLYQSNGMGWPLQEPKKPQV